MIDFGRLSWTRVQGKVEKAINNQEKRKKFIKDFQSSWCRKSLFAVWETDHPQWNLAVLGMISLSSSQEYGM